MISQHSSHLKLRMFSTNEILPNLGSASAVAGVIAFHEAGHFFAAKWQGMKVQSFNIGYGPKLLSFNDTMNTEFALRVLPLGGYVAFPSNIDINEEGEEVGELNDPDLLQNRPPLQRALVISAGVLANLLLTVILASGTAATSGISHQIFDKGILVTASPSTTSPAFKAGILKGDIVRSLNGIDVTNGKENSVTDDSIERFVSNVRMNEGKPMELGIERNGQALEKKFIVTPIKNQAGRVSVGINIGKKVNHVELDKASNPIQAIGIGVRETEKLIYMTWNAFSTSLGNGFKGGEVGGPISVVRTGASMAQATPTALIGFAATLSVNLAVLNALPYPALDGGQLAFVMAELISGRKVPRKIQEAVTGLAFVGLLALGATTFGGDISRLSDPIIISPK